MNEIPFESFGKIPRYSRDILITEKIDGTNAQIVFDDDSNLIAVGSRNRWITPEDDNYGFAKWVHENVEELKQLGPGHHFGEWWGSGIQRGYGLTKGEKRFSLFNVHRWGKNPALPSCCSVVPTLYEGPNSERKIIVSLNLLRELGSYAQNTFMNPEGVIIYHKASRQLFKKLLENDEMPKGDTCPS